MNSAGPMAPMRGVLPAQQRLDALDAGRCADSPAAGTAVRAAASPMADAQLATDGEPPHAVFIAGLVVELDCVASARFATYIATSARCRSVWASRASCGARAMPMLTPTSIATPCDVDRRAQAVRQRPCDVGGDRRAHRSAASIAVNSSPPMRAMKPAIADASRGNGAPLPAGCGRRRRARACR